ncbi:hypothetical protein V9T40_000960 [Parthenolecanium corni]|uniref:Phosphatidylinositol-glycan biosynthesis class X protein n=1 Tax=Parthenolecanium corni TaxID=536013 RepID=A0AAN9Y0X0_9HEMI
MKHLWNYIALPYLFVQYTYALVDITVNQALLNSGFHRSLTTNITLYANLTWCHLLVEDKFPRNVFINVNEVEDSADDIHVRTDQNLDLEATASASNSFSAYIYLNRNEPVQTSTEFSSKYIYTLPVHVRYHDPKTGGGYREFKKHQPTLFARCPTELSLPSSVIVSLPCDHSSAKVCKWTSLPFTQKSVLPPILVPVGDLDHHLPVYVSTHLAAYTGVVIVIYSLFSI